MWSALLLSRRKRYPIYQKIKLGGEEGRGPLDLLSIRFLGMLVNINVHGKHCNYIDMDKHVQSFCCSSCDFLYFIVIIML